MTKEYLKSLGPIRVFINSPSKLQPYYKYHGKVCIAVVTNNKTETVTVFFTEGRTHSIEINPLYLSLKY